MTQLPTAYNIPDSSECVFIWLDTVSYCDDHETDNCECGQDVANEGYYYALGMRGFMYNSDAIGPFDSEREAYNDANTTFDLSMSEWG